MPTSTKPGQRSKRWQKSMPRPSPLLRFLADARSAGNFDGETLSLLIAEARTCGVLHRLLARLPAGGATSVIDELRQASQVHRHSFQRDVRRELTHLEAALSGLKTPVILLKGAAYVAQNLPPSEGRVFSDIDLLVAKNMIGQTEAALMLGGWSTGHLDAYDERYYRTWSHEIPPMTHLQRGTTVDLHHSLVMPTCRLHVDSAAMIAAAIPIDGHDGRWWRLQDEDMVLHATSHLLLNGEFDRGLRDLWDIDLLYRHFVDQQPQFHERLLARATEVGLAEVAVSALRLAAGIFQTPLAQALPTTSWLPQRLLASAVSTRHPLTRPATQGLADFVLFLREMYLRLPNRLLAIHLAHKIGAAFRTPARLPELTQ